MRLFTRRLLSIAVLVLFAFNAHAALTANFTASSIAGCSPLVVNFTNTSTPMAGTTFSWNLGLGGTPVPTVNASSSYISPGTYTITLTATNGGETSTHTMTVTVYPAPTVSFIASAVTVCPGSPVVFTNTSAGGVPGPMTCTWNFGDGTTGSGSPVSHAYTTPGVYNITLSVTNADGCTSTLLRTGYITVLSPPGVSFYATPATFCSAPGHAVFTGSTTGPSPLTYTWRFGDGSAPSTLASPSHDYLTAGSFTVTLIVTDGNGCTDSLTRPAYIHVSNLHASFTLPGSACVYSGVTFTNTSGAHLSRTWYYGDGSTDTAYNGSHAYSAPGTYTVKLVIFDGYCYDTVTHTITILAGPAASFSLVPLSPCPPPTTVTFSPTTPPGTLISWIYGDGTTGTSPTHTYYRRGYYTIRMVATNPVTGCRDTVSQTDLFYDLIKQINTTVDRGCVPLTTTFSERIFTMEPDTTKVPLDPYPFPITTYSWDFGDGSPVSPTAIPTHTYTTPGTYTAVLTFMTANGCIFHDTAIIHVGDHPLMSVTASPTHLCFHDNMVMFTGTVLSGIPDSFVWSFGDGSGGFTHTSSTGHSFTIPGYFTTTVTPYWNGCPGPPVTTTLITIDSPKSMIWDSILCTGNRVMFADSSMGDDAHLWMFGDGTTSTLDNPLHTYPTATTYTVTLTTYNIRSGCRDTVSIPIDLRRPSVTFSAPDTAICRDSFAAFHAVVVPSTFSVSYEWGTLPTSTPDPGTTRSSTFIDTFHTTGQYSVFLRITWGNHCDDTISRPNYMLVAKPVANFTVSPSTGCWPLHAVFTDMSTDVPTTFFSFYHWDFGDGTSTLVATPSVAHTFTSAGTFYTTEIVTDNIGCRDTVTKGLVTVWRPSAVFAVTNQHPCPGDSVLFTNSSTGIVNSKWFFGDGTTSVLNSPWHTYPGPGTYTVSLVVTDAHGCTDTATYINYISVAKPHAAFYMNDSMSVCPPLMVHFTNTSIGATSYNWAMGDGSGSLLTSPSNMYISIGLDTVRLIATNAYGCHDTAYGHVMIFGYAGGFTFDVDSGCAPLTVHFHAATLNVPNIIWDFADGSISTVSYTDSISHIYTRPGAYLPKLILADNTGCQNSSIAVDTIKVDAIIGWLKVIPTPVCIGDTFMLVDSSWSYFSIETSRRIVMNGVLTTLDSTSYFINAIGSYPASISVADGWGCTDSVNQNVNIYGRPTIKACPDTMVCVGDPAVLTGYGGVSYTWKPTGSLSCIACNPTNASPAVVTNYTVTGMDAHGCTNTDTVSVLLRTSTVSVALGDTDVCAGTPVTLFDSGGTKYTWIPNYGLDNNHSPTPVATPPYTTKYMAIAQLAGCIPDTNYVTVVIYPLPTVDAGPDQRLVAGSTANLNAKAHLATHYEWDNANTLTCDTCASTVASMTMTTTYAVTVTSEHGCKNSDSLTIKLYCGKSQIFMPNSFTPNGDGQNDLFYPRGTGVSIVKSFRIYNRWGELLFERSNFDLNDATYGWDGSYKGDTPRPDVYVYVVDAICDTGEPINIKGDVTIIR